MKPDVSVIMSVHNGALYLADAIESILQQSVENFEFIIVNDGSTDNSAEIIRSYGDRDKRIVILINEKRMGLTGSLNRALAVAKGKFIARQDADDISVADRLESQLKVFAGNSEVGLVGTAITFINKDGQPGKTLLVPENDTVIRWQMLYRNIFKHASIMIRSIVLKEHNLQYDESLIYAQDYDFWSRILMYCRGYNIQRPLVFYRVHEYQISTMFSEKQQQLADNIGAKAVNRLGVAGIGPEQQSKLRAWSRSLPEKLTRDDMAFLRKYFMLLAAFAQQPFVDPLQVRIISKKFVEYCLRSVSMHQVHDLVRSGLFLLLLRHNWSSTIFWPFRRLMGRG